MTRRKHKRGERGSIEDDQSSSKRVNTASKENDPVEEETEEPSRLELQEMLVDIKIDVSNILRENGKLTKELAELRSLMKEQKDEIDAMEVSIKKSKDQNFALENEDQRSTRRNSRTLLSSGQPKTVHKKAIS